MGARGLADREGTERGQGIALGRDRADPAGVKVEASSRHIMHHRPAQTGGLVSNNGFQHLPMSR